MRQVRIMQGRRGLVPHMAGRAMGWAAMVWTAMVWAAVAIIVASQPACREDQLAGERVATSRPAERVAEKPVHASQPAATQPAEPDDTPHADTHHPDDKSATDPAVVILSELDDLETGWLEIEGKGDEVRRSWAEGWMVGDRKIVINTENVARFRLDLSRLRVNWKKRVILRLDGYNSELTRKRWPVIHFLRTPAGAWEVVNPK